MDFRLSIMESVVEEEMGNRGVPMVDEDEDDEP
jgi:hypothetical protein